MLSVPIKKKEEKMVKDTKLSKIYETNDFKKFIFSSYCLNAVRIKYLEMKKLSNLLCK